MPPPLRSLPQIACGPTRNAAKNKSPAISSGRSGVRVSARLGRLTPAKSPATKHQRPWRAAKRSTAELRYPGPPRMVSGSHSASPGTQIRMKHMSTMIRNIGSAALVI